MRTTISERNKWAIHDFGVLNQQTRITGTKLEALYRLVQKQGEPVQGIEVDGGKALEYQPGNYVGFIHTPFKAGSFFPCRLRTVILTIL